MRTVLAVLALIAGIAACLALSACDRPPPSLLQQYGCSSCHAPDRKLVGPALRDIAAKYRGRADAEALLITKVRNGGAGVWGLVAMPPHPTIPDKALRELIGSILALPAE